MDGRCHTLFEASIHVLTMAIEAANQRLEVGEGIVLRLVSADDLV